MNRLLFVLFACFSLTFAFSAQGQRSLIMNGSFEQNGYDIPDVNEEPPVFWCDVNVPADKFEAWLDETGSTQGLYALTLSTMRESFVNGETASVSQEVFFEDDIKELSFDLSLSSGLSFIFPWDANLRTVFVAIDGQICWDSNDLEIDDGEYSGTIQIDSADFASYLNNSEHKLTFALRVNESADASIEYYADIDFVKFDKYCGGLGFLDGDLNQDCFVNLTDLAVLGLSWMNEPASLKNDLYEDGIVDEYDLELFAEDWLYNTDWTKWGQDGTFQMERLELDLDLSGEIDLGELVVLSEYWLSDGRCAGIELSGNDIVNFEDFAALVNQWGLRDWLYYVQD